LRRRTALLDDDDDDDQFDISGEDRHSFHASIRHRLP
jgi:hypothetical protein